MKLQERYDSILEILEASNPDPKTELDYQTPFQLLVAVILSAQCTDKRVNVVAPRLFLTYPTPQKMASASQEEIYEVIKSISYPNSKAKYLKNTASSIVSKHNGILPRKRKELEALQGVGRKTANVMLSVLHNEPTMAVDTHVFRLAHRLGLVKKAHTTPLSVEKQLTKHITKQRIPKAHHWFILHGRYVCTAQRPKCKSCALSHLCPYHNTKQRKQRV